MSRHPFLLLLAALTLVAACGGSEDSQPTPPATATDEPTQVLPEVGRANPVGEFELTVLKVTVILAADSGRALPSGTNVLKIDLAVRNLGTAATKAPALTLSCAGSVVGGRLAEEGAGSLTSATIESRANEVGFVLFGVPGACQQAILLARPEAAAGGRPPQPVPIRVN